MSKLPAFGNRLQFILSVKSNSITKDFSACRVYCRTCIPRDLRSEGDRGK